MNAIPASLGIYSVPDAARITGVHPRQIRGWLQGYSQRQGKTAAPPILHRQHEIRDGELASAFLIFWRSRSSDALVRLRSAEGGP